MTPKLSRRASGVLLHPSSLPGPRGGALGAAALGFVDFLADCGQSWWQMLPVCPPDEFGSPYASPSSFAGSPTLICADLLAADGFLKRAELGQPRPKALRAALTRFSRRARHQERVEFDAFRDRESVWLREHALFLALKDAQEGRPWVSWDEPLRRRDPSALEAARGRLASELRYHEFAQWLFSRQWEALRRHAAIRGVALMGDIPIYVSHDSADCWTHQELFFLNEDGWPTAVAGVPPDHFSAQGQLWGNPLYRWERHRQTGFAWWLGRLKSYAERFDAVRLDHFIGLRNYWEIPAGASSAANGRWVHAPGAELLEAVRHKLPGLELIAEDLGVLTPPVAELRERFGLPGMRVAQFSFGDSDTDWPARWPQRCVGYTGTHDNDTARGWWEDEGSLNAGRGATLAERERRSFRRALGREPDPPSWDLVGLVWRSPASVALAPMQDLLNIGSEGRMNRPGSSDGNWRWRLDAGALTPRLAGRLALLTGACGRAPESSP